MSNFLHFALGSQCLGCFAWLKDVVRYLQRLQEMALEQRVVSVPFHIYPFLVRDTLRSH